MVYTSVDYLEFPAIIWDALLTSVTSTHCSRKKSKRARDLAIIRLMNGTVSLAGCTGAEVAGAADMHALGLQMCTLLAFCSPPKFDFPYPRVTLPRVRLAVDGVPKVLKTFPMCRWQNTR